MRTVASRSSGTGADAGSVADAATGSGGVTIAGATAGTIKRATSGVSILAEGTTGGAASMGAGIAISIVFDADAATPGSST